MSFVHAPVTKALMLWLGTSALLIGVFDIKHYLHLQLVPHMTRHHQYWRFLSHHLTFTSSSDLVVAQLLLFKGSIPVERQFGSVKFASFLVASILVSTTLEALSLFIFHPILGLNHVPAGPFSLLFSIIYQYSRIVPSTYAFRIFGVPMDNNIFLYFLSLQLIGRGGGTILAFVLGILTGQIYRSDLLLNVQSYRIPPPIVRFSRRFLTTESRAPRHNTRAFPDPASSSSSSSIAAPVEPEPEPITTAPRHPPAQPPPQQEGPSVVREWMNELTGRNATDVQRAIRVPTDAEVAQLSTMFSSIPRQTIVETLQRRKTVQMQKQQ